jgi:hypothetical protein
VMGTLGVVQLAAAKGLVNFAMCIGELRKTSIRLPEKLVLELLEEEAKREKGSA